MGGPTKEVGGVVEVAYWISTVCPPLTVKTLGLTGDIFIISLCWSSGDF